VVGQKTNIVIGHMDDIIISRMAYVDASCCYRLSSVVCRSVTLVSPAKNGWTDRDAVWDEDSGGPREPCIIWGSRSPHGKGQFFLGEKGRPIVKYRDTLQSVVQKRLNRLRCRLDFGFGWSQGIIN